MTDSSSFVLDANVFIEAKNRYYAFDLAPRFWESLILHASNGLIKSIDKVKKELEDLNDELSIWIKNHLNKAFVSTDDEEVICVFGAMQNWANNQPQFMDAAKADFANAADGWLVAYAKAKNCVVVTKEVLAPEAKRKIKIPNVCQAFDVPFIDTFEMLRRLGVRFA